LKPAAAALDDLAEPSADRVATPRQKLVTADTDTQAQGGLTVAVSTASTRRRKEAKAAAEAAALTPRLLVAAAAVPALRPLSFRRPKSRSSWRYKGAAAAVVPKNGQIKVRAAPRQRCWCRCRCRCRRRRCW
jgi:hypothetical protein